MAGYRNSDYKPYKYIAPSKEDAIIAVTAMIFYPQAYDNQQWRINLAGAISLLGLSEFWDGDSDISSSYTGTLEIMTSLCEQIRDCILNNQETKDAILQAVLEGGYYPSATIKPIIQGQGADNLLEGLSCADNDIKGYAKTIIEYCNDVALDAIQVFASETSESLLPARVLDYIPLLGDLPFLDDLSDAVTWLTTTLVAQYEAGYTEELRDELVCAIYELACSDCVLTAHDLILAISNVAGFPFDASSTFEDVVRLLTGTTDDTLVALMFIATVIAALGSGGKVLGYIGVKGIKQIISNSVPYILEDCEECPEPSFCGLPIFDLGLNQETPSDCTTLVNGVFFAGDTINHAEVRDTALNPRNVEIDYDIDADDIFSVNVSMRLVVLENNRHYWSVQCYDALGNIVSETGQIMRDDSSPVMVSTTRVSSGAAIKRVKLRHYRATGGFGAYYAIREVSIS